MLPTIKQLQYLVALADHLHFGHAARACHVTQPALSEQLKNLEGDLGVQLAERSGRRVLLTPAGQRLADRARALLNDLAEAAELARCGGAPLTAPLRLGVIPTVAPYLLPPMLSGLRRAYPALRLFLREEKTGVLLRRLEEGLLDLAVLALPLPAAPAGLTSIALYREAFMLAVPQGHALARQRHVRPADLAGEPLLLLEEGHCLRDQALEFCAAAGPRNDDSFRATSLGTLVQMVANGLGVTLLPRLAVEVELRGADEWIALPFAAPAPYRTIGLVWRSASARGKEYRLLAGAMKRLLPKPVAPQSHGNDI